MPQGLIRELEARIGPDAPARIGAIASLRTSRVTVRLRDAEGVELVELADDRVEASNELTGGRQAWREWEAELMPGAGATVLDRLEPLLVAAGATRVRGTSKIQRTMSLPPAPEMSLTSATEMPTPPAAQIPIPPSRDA